MTRSAAIAVLVLNFVLIARPASGSIQVDLRFWDGTKIKSAYPGQYPVNVWARVTGENGLPDEGLLYVYGAIRSRQIHGGAIHAGYSGVTSNVAASPIFTTGSYMGQPGVQQILSDDGVSDWGITSTRKTTSIKYNTVLYGGLHPAYLNTEHVTANEIPNGVEFKVGTFTVTINPEDVTSVTGGNAATAFDWLSSDSKIPYPFLAWMDGNPRGTGKPVFYLPSTNLNSVQFTAPRGGIVAIPEPGAVAVFAFALCELIARPGRRSNYDA